MVILIIYVIPLTLTIGAAYYLYSIDRLSEEEVADSWLSGVFWPVMVVCLIVILPYVLPLYIIDKVKENRRRKKQDD